jgi:hypothetical protein
MKLQDLFQLAEAESKVAADGPVEVADIVGRSSKQIAEKYIRALWGKPRLVYNGKPFFGDGDTVYDDINKALKATLKGYEVEKRVEFKAPRINGRVFDQFDVKTEVDDFQEVYLGFSPSTKSLYVGVDCWIDGEDDFNETFETEFGEVLDVAFDEEDEQHSLVANNAWKAYRNSSMVSILFRVNDEELEEEFVEDGSFYSSIFRSQIFKRYNLVNLRLD